jgi:virginiamycin B lyase
MRCLNDDIRPGPDGALWFTETNGDATGRFTTDGVFTEYPIPFLLVSTTNGIAVGPDGALWFAGQNESNIGRITTSGVITLYPAPTPNSDPVFITPGPDGALWSHDGKYLYFSTAPPDPALYRLRLSDREWSLS